VVWLDVISIVFSLSLALSGTWRGLNLFELTKTGFVFFLLNVPVELVEERLHFDLFVTNLKSGS
jgi:hypothetical protein